MCIDNDLYEKIYVQTIHVQQTLMQAIIYSVCKNGTLSC